MAVFNIFVIPDLAFIIGAPACFQFLISFLISPDTRIPYLCAWFES